MFVEDRETLANVEPGCPSRFSSPGRPLVAKNAMAQDVLNWKPVLLQLGLSQPRKKDEKTQEACAENGYLPALSHKLNGIC